MDVHADDLVTHEYAVIPGHILLLLVEEQGLGERMFRKPMEQEQSLLSLDEHVVHDATVFCAKMLGEPGLVHQKELSLREEHVLAVHSTCNEISPWPMLLDRPREFPIELMYHFPRQSIQTEPIVQRDRSALFRPGFLRSKAECDEWVLGKVKEGGVLLMMLHVGEPSDIIIAL
jgi:hypothetical protein